MNTEEKAHAYDEVMDKIKPLYEQAKRDGNPIWSTYEYLIPELADSEDEKVRKWIASYIHRGVFNEEEHPMALKAIEYLEKQKEQPISITEVLARAGLKPYKDGNKWCILIGDNIQEGICGFGDTIDEALYQFLLEVLEKQKAMDAIPDELVKSYKFFIENGRREIEEVVNAINNLNEQKKHQNKSDAPKEKKLGSNFYPSDKDKNLDEIAQDYVDGVKDYNPEPTWDLMQTAVCYGYHYCEQKEHEPTSTEDMPYITDEHFYEREPADSFKYKLAEYMTKCCTKKEGPYGYTYGISAEAILKMAEEELLKRGVVQKPEESMSHLTVQGKGTYKICPRCKERMVRDDSKVYTSMPPQYGYECPKCGKMEFDTIMYDNPEIEEQKPAEWVLPKDFEEAVYKVANFISPFDNQEELRKTSHRFAEQLLSLAKKELDNPAEWDELQSEFKNSNEEFEDGKKEVVAHPERYGLCKPAEWSKDTLDEFTENIRSLITRKLTYHDPNGSGISSTVFIDDETAKDIANGVLFYVGKEAVKNPKREIPEWSEEDEKHLNSILDAIDYWETTSGQGILLDTDINWLKFLRWKKH